MDFTLEFASLAMLQRETRQLWDPFGKMFLFVSENKPNPHFDQNSFSKVNVAKEITLHYLYTRTISWIEGKAVAMLVGPGSNFFLQSQKCKS